MHCGETWAPRISHAGVPVAVNYGVHDGAKSLHPLTVTVRQMGERMLHAEMSAV